MDSLNINGEKYDAIKTLEELIVGEPGWKIKGLEFLIQLLDPSDTPVKFTTSGTTGDPKEIKFSKKQIWKSAANTCGFFEIGKGDELLLCLPADFVAGRMMMARALLAEAKLIWVEPSLNPLKNILNIDFAAFTPAQVSTIIGDPVSRRSFGEINKVIIGGGEISVTLENELRGFKNEIYATYGMTETLTHVAVRKIGENRFCSVYDDHDLVFSVDDNNCLIIELPFIDKNKIITRDIVELIDARSFVWKGRLDNVINSGGLKIYAEDLEKRISLSGIMESDTFYIAGQKDAVFGEIPVIVLLKNTDKITLDTLLPRINVLLNKHEVVKHIVFLDKFERTETGKIKRQKF